jgi:hypothetical protein
MLADTQKRLDEHFLLLSRQRVDLGYPVYALEHGLDLSEISSLRSALANDLARTRALSKAYWLPWIVVASEIGYTYDGDEYWDTFARNIPNWRLYGDRATIRRWFELFANRYEGVRPSGRWAKHFSIIAWPITHAILPCDLQGQFAQRIYDLRFELARRSGASLEELGSILQMGEPVGASRFQHFLDQTELTARLILALRDEDVLDATPIIYRATLIRIVADLERRQSARDWLREARTILREARIRASAGSSHRGGEVAEHGVAGSEGGVGVRLIARQSAEGDWMLGVCFPDLGQIVQQAGVKPKNLDQTRIRLADQPNRWMPGRALFTLARREQPIQSLRQLADEPILILDRDVEGLSKLLAKAFRIKGVSPWLLRIQDDGVARQLIGNYVRAGQGYLIVSDIRLAPEMIDHLKLQVVNTGIEKAYVYLLSVPRTLSLIELRALDAIKIGYKLCANIEPVGLVPRWDSATGRSVWLTTEELLFRLSADYPVREFSISINQCAVTRITVGNLPEVIISLGHLPVGVHAIEVSGLTPGKQADRLEMERVDIEVRSPQPWRQGVRQQAGFRVIREPANALLDDILNGKARLAVIGPLGRQVCVDVRLFNLSGHMTERIPLGCVRSGDEGALRRRVAKLAKEPHAEKLQTAPRADLFFTVDELGVDSLSFSRKVHPFRWRLTANARDYRARLIDEAGADHPVTVKQYNISQPDLAIEANYNQCLSGHIVAAPGALLVATSDGKSYSAIISVPPQQPLTALTDLGAAITVSLSINALKHIPKLLFLLRLWGGAHQVLGPLGILRKAEICNALEQRLAVIVCGSNWASQAWKCRLARVPALAQLQREIGASPGFGVRLKTTDWRRAIENKNADAQFSYLAKFFKVSDNQDLCEMAFQLALAPTTIKLNNPGKRGGADWTLLTEFPALARGAFFVRLLIDLAGNSLPTTERGRT